MLNELMVTDTHTGCSL